MNRKSFNCGVALLSASVVSALLANSAYANVPYKPVEVYNKQGQQLIGAEIGNRVMSTEWTMSSLDPDNKVEIGVKPLVTSDHNVYFIPSALANTDTEPGRYLIEGADGTRFIFNYLGVPLEAASGLSMAESDLYDSDGGRAYAYNDGSGRFIAVARGTAGLDKEYVEHSKRTEIVRSWSGEVGPFISFSADSNGRITTAHNSYDNTRTRFTDWVYKNASSNLDLPAGYWRPNEMTQAIAATGRDNRSPNRQIYTEIGINLIDRASSGSTSSGNIFRVGEDVNGGVPYRFNVTATDPNGLENIRKGIAVMVGRGGIHEITGFPYGDQWVQTEMTSSKSGYAYDVAAGPDVTSKVSWYSNLSEDPARDRLGFEVPAYRTGLPANGVMFTLSPDSGSYDGDPYLEASPGDGLFLVKKAD